MKDSEWNEIGAWAKQQGGAAVVVWERVQSLLSTREYWMERYVEECAEWGRDGDAEVAKTMLDLYRGETP